MRRKKPIFNKTIKKRRGITECNRLDASLTEVNVGSFFVRVLSFSLYIKDFQPSSINFRTIQSTREHMFKKTDRYVYPNENENENEDEDSI